VGRPHAEHLHLAGVVVDLDLGHLCAEDIALPRRGLARLGVQWRMRRGEQAAADDDDAALLLEHVHRVFHRHALARRALDPDLAGEGLHALGADAPVRAHRCAELAEGLAAGDGHCVADHVRHAGGAGVRRLGHAGGVVVAQHDVVGPHAHLLRRDLAQAGEHALADLRHAGGHLDGAAVVELDPHRRAVHRRRARDAVPATGHASSTMLHVLFLTWQARFRAVVRA
jgi:uncharacterized protein YbjQ (UPF0145 family)